MSVLTQDLHSTATRQLLEICCAFLPEQRAQVKDLAQAKVPWHTIASLYPLDWRHLHANFALPHIPEPLDLVLEIVGTYNTVEDNLWEVEGGAYGAAGKGVLRRAGYLGLSAAHRSHPAAASGFRA